MLASLRTSGKAASPRRASSGKAASNVLATAALQRMEHDPDISAERDGTRAVAAGAAVPKRVPLNVVNQSHRANAATAALAAEAFADPQLDPFIRDHGDPHGQRFANWIFEKMGGGPLDDCRVWMRLHFWAARETGIFDDHPAFAARAGVRSSSAARDTLSIGHYVRLIGHFVSVYERTAPPFARESARWSADPAQVADYVATKRMKGVVDAPLRDALARLRRGATAAGRRLWPYERRKLGL
ncbi:hypothetical protein JL721_3833 [Aureococcus anophagefferens]|nr:hypothetical protein JL721_3833 [Aureococcus anophagefferens]